MPSIMEFFEQGGEGGGLGQRPKEISWADFNANPSQYEGASDFINGVHSIYQGGKWQALGPEGEESPLAGLAMFAPLAFAGGAGFLPGLTAGVGGAAADIPASFYSGLEGVGDLPASMYTGLESIVPSLNTPANFYDGLNGIPTTPTLPGQPFSPELDPTNPLNQGAPPPVDQPFSPELDPTNPLNINQQLPTIPTTPAGQTVPSTPSTPSPSTPGTTPTPPLQETKLPTLPPTVPNSTNTPSTGGGPSASGGVKDFTDFLKSNKDLLLPGAAFAYSALSKGKEADTSKLDSIANALASQAGSGAGSVNKAVTDAANSLIPTVSTGVLPAGAQAQVDNATQDAIGAIRAKYAQLGLSGSTMETQEINAAHSRAQAVAFEMANQLTNTGLTAAGIATSQNMDAAKIYELIMNTQLSNDNQLRDALAKFAQAAAFGQGAAAVKKS